MVADDVRQTLLHDGKPRRLQALLDEFPARPEAAHSARNERGFVGNSRSPSLLVGCAGGDACAGAMDIDRHRCDRDSDGRAKRLKQHADQWMHRASRGSW